LEHGYGQPDETGATFAENALLKARYYSLQTGFPALSDDSGLCVDALGGAPGISSARYAPTDEARIARLLAELSAAGANTQRGRTARFICVAALAWPDGRAITAEGALEGSIASEPSGFDGFGYDPVFFLPDRGVTVAGLSAADKNAISHRSLALRRLAEKVSTTLGSKSDRA
jgi:XTP/dITP diphosphohydrolase